VVAPPHLAVYELSQPSWNEIAAASPPLPIHDLAGEPIPDEQLRCVITLGIADDEPFDDRPHPLEHSFASMKLDHDEVDDQVVARGDIGGRRIVCHPDLRR
jgi:hypothetical protein